MRFRFRTRSSYERADSPRARAILAGAKRVFIRDGAAGFSGRAVARETHVSLGALQHFFPTMDGLLAAMLEFVINDYDEAYERVARRLPLNAGARLHAAIELLVADLWRPDTRNFFFGLWALSCHNRFAARLVNEMYEHHRRNIAVFIGGARPDLPEDRCYELAAQAAALIEGSMLFTGPGARRTQTRKAFSEAVSDGVLRLIADPGRTGTPVRGRLRNA